MISLEVEKYCDNCREFKPDIIVTGERGLGHTPVFNTVVVCNHADRCHAMMEYLKRCDAK